MYKSRNPIKLTFIEGTKQFLQVKALKNVATAFGTPEYCHLIMASHFSHHEWSISD